MTIPGDAAMLLQVTCASRRLASEILASPTDLKIAYDKSIEDHNEAVKNAQEFLDQASEARRLIDGAYATIRRHQEANAG